MNKTQEEIRMRYGEIYAIGTPVGVYVGRALGWATGRWSSHLRLLREGTHHNSRLQAAYNDLGPQSLTFSLLEVNVPESDLDLREYEHGQAFPDLISEPPSRVAKAILWEEIFDQIDQGRSYRSIASEYGCSLGQISKRNNQRRIARPRNLPER